MNNTSLAKANASTLAVSPSTEICSNWFSKEFDYFRKWVESAHAGRITVLTIIPLMTAYIFRLAELGCAEVALQKIYHALCGYCENIATALCSW